MSVGETIRAHGKAAAILVVFAAMAVTLLQGELPRFEATGNAIADQLPDLSPGEMRDALHAMLYLLVLTTVILAGYQAKLLIAGRQPRSGREGTLMNYILMARQQGFSDAQIAARLVGHGWDEAEVKRTMTAAQTLKTGPG